MQTLNYLLKLQFVSFRVKFVQFYFLPGSLIVAPVCDRADVRLPLGCLESICPLFSFVAGFFSIILVNFGH